MKSGSSDKFDLGVVEGEQLEDKEGFIPVAVGLAGEGLDLVVHALHFGFIREVWPCLVPEQIDVSPRGVGRLG